MISHVPKSIVVSSMHYSEIVENNTGTSEMISFYNTISIKDAIDEKCKKY